MFGLRSDLCIIYQPTACRRRAVAVTAELACQSNADWMSEALRRDFGRNTSSHSRLVLPLPLTLLLLLPLPLTLLLSTTMLVEEEGTCDATCVQIRSTKLSRDLRTPTTTSKTTTPTPIDVVESERVKSFFNGVFLDTQTICRGAQISSTCQPAAQLGLGVSVANFRLGFSLSLSPFFEASSKSNSSPLVVVAELSCSGFKVEFGWHRKTCAADTQRRAQARNSNGSVNIESHLSSQLATRQLAPNPQPQSLDRNFCQTRR